MPRVRAVLAGVLALLVLLGFQALAPAVGDDEVSFLGFGSLTAKSRPGTDFAVGASVTNDGDTSIIVKSVTVGGQVPTEQGYLREVLVFDGSKHNGVGAIRWPDDDFERFTRPVRDEVVAPGEQLEVVLVFEIRGSGPMRWSSGTVTYEIDGDTREVDGWMDLMLCPTVAVCMEDEGA